MGMFDVAADAYVRYMGRFSLPLAPAFAAFGLSGVDPDARVLDVGCGPGVLTAELVKIRGGEKVGAIDPMPAFVAATAAAFPDVDVHGGRAEALPFDDDSFAATLAQLVVHFMADPAAGVREMVRVTAPGGRVSACVWDHGGGTGPLSEFWRVVRRLDPTAGDESELVGSRRGDLTDLFERAGLGEVEERALTVTVGFSGFDEFWEPFMLGVGPSGAYLESLDERARATLVDELRREYGEGPFEVSGTAWAATGLVPASAS